MRRTMTTAFVLDPDGHNIEAVRAIDDEPHRVAVRPLSLKRPLLSALRHVFNVRNSCE